MHHKMSHIAVKGIGINSDQFRDAVDKLLDNMSAAGWELVSTNINETSGMMKDRGVDAMFFWKRPS